VTAIVWELLAHVGAPLPGITYAYEGEYWGYEARCESCEWIGSFHAIGLESAPNAAAVYAADAHNENVHA
jgi:hypothetical protein